MKNKVVVAGFGNILRSDDGIGPKIIAGLKKDESFCLSSNCDLIDCGVDGFKLLDLAEKYARIVVIDAVDMNAVPGTVKGFIPEEAKIKIKSSSLSTHGIGLAEIITLIEGFNLRTSLQIIGIQPLDISFGEELSQEIQMVIPKIIELIKCATLYQQK
jgi:hydrogenase maturation protease